MGRHTKRWVVLAALLVAFGSLATARAADQADPTGDWSWTFNRNGQDIEIHMTLKADGEKLTGTVGREERKTDIQDGSFKDGEVAFKVVRERNGQTFSQNYKGKLEGDAIKGTVEFSFNGQDRSRDWEAKRVK